MSRNIVLLYENKKWDMGLVRVLERHGFACTLWPLFDICLPLTAPKLPPQSIILNRFSPSFSTRSNGNTLGAVRALVRLLESHGHHVINGSRAVELEVSKVAQMIACRQVGLQCPYTEMSVGNYSEIVRRWRRHRGPRVPLVIKPNCGGSGNHVRVFPTADALEEARQKDDWIDDISVDGITLVQQMVEAPFIHRLEFVGHAFLYAVRIRTQGGSFNRCPCEQELEKEEGSGTCTLPPKFEILFDFPQNKSEWMLIQALLRMLRANQVYIAGIEVIQDKQGRWWVIDCNCVNTNYNLTAEKKANVPVGGNERIAQWLSANPCFNPRTHSATEPPPPPESSESDASAAAAAAAAPDRS